MRNATLLGLLLTSSQTLALIVDQKALSAAIVAAPLVATVEVTDLTSDENPITTIASARVIALHKNSLATVSEGSDLLIEIPGGSVKSGFLQYSGVTYPVRSERYEATLTPTDHGTFQVVGFEMGLRSVARHAVRNQVDCPGSNPAYVHWDRTYMPIPFFISGDSFLSQPELIDGIRPSFEAWRNIDATGIDFVPMGCTKSQINENDGVNSIILITQGWRTPQGAQPTIPATSARRPASSPTMEQLMWRWRKRSRTPWRRARTSKASSLPGRTCGSPTRGTQPQPLGPPTTT